MSPRLPHPLLAVQSDGRLTELIERGHERAFEALVKRYRAPLLAYCRRLGLSEQQAEDVLQQSFTSAWLALGGGVEVREARPWLYRVVHNTAVSALRRRVEESEEPALLEQAAEPREEQGTIERGLAARDALGRVAALPAMQREALVLTALQGRSHEEAAGVLGVSDGAVRGLLHRARTTLRSAAAAFTPQGLLAWLSRAPAALPGAAERSGEMAAGGGAIGVAGAALKGALVAATAGVLVAGGVLPHAHVARRAASALGAVASGSGGSESDAEASGATVPGSALASLGLSAGVNRLSAGKAGRTDGGQGGGDLRRWHRREEGWRLASAGQRSHGVPAEPGENGAGSEVGPGAESRFSEAFRGGRGGGSEPGGTYNDGDSSADIRQGPGAGAGQSFGRWSGAGDGSGAGQGSDTGRGSGSGQGSATGQGATTGTDSGGSGRSGADGSREDLRHGRFEGSTWGPGGSSEGPGTGATEAEWGSAGEQRRVLSRGDEQGAQSLEGK